MRRGSRWAHTRSSPPTGRASSSSRASGPGAIFRLPVTVRSAALGWFIAIASACWWLPAYKGRLGGEDMWALVVPYALLAVAVAMGLRHQVETTREAMLAALPALGLLLVALIVGVFTNDHRAAFRGEPLMLYFGVALWMSWATLVLVSAGGCRTRWNGLLGVALTLLVAGLGLLLFTARFD